MERGEVTTTKKAAAKKTTKKTAKKTAKKARKKSGSKKGPVREAVSKADRVAALLRTVNKPGEPPVIHRAEETASSYLLRRPTGILSLDLALAGGFPASAPIMITGSDGAGKDYLFWRMCAQLQRIYGEDFRIMVYLTEFRPDKPFMRGKCGLKVAMTKDELDEWDEARVRAGHPKLTPEERNRYQEQIGDIHLLEGISAEKAFDVLIKAVATNAYQVIAINSIGFLQTKAKEDVDSFEEFAQQRNEALLMSKFMPKLAMILNRDVYGERNETTVVMINQVRSKDQAPRMRGRPLQESDKVRSAVQAWALKHGKAIELMLHKGRTHYDEVAKLYTGRVTKWSLEKGKLGTHDGIRGEYDYFYDDGVDEVGDILKVALDLGVVEQNGSWYSYSDPDADEGGGDLSFLAQGTTRARRALLDRPELRERLRTQCFQAAGVVCRYR